MREGAGPTLTGQTIGIYEVGPELGRGGMGTVYRARTTAEGAPGPAGTAVALKVFHPELVSDETTFKRFQREAELGMRIRHPNVVRTFEIGSETSAAGPVHYMAMEVVEGQTLRDLIQEMGTLPDHLIYQIADQALDALGAVHAENMIHRDIKPENLVLTRDHRLLLMDLGVARLQQEGRDLTRAGEFVGSVAYAAPEQFLDQDHVGPLADLYSFGVVLYEMATGRNPFGSAEISTIITQKVKGIVRRPKLVQRDLDPFLDDVILTCLQQDPAQRFASCEALRTVLREGEQGAWWQGRIEGEAYPAAARALSRLRPPREIALIGRGADLDGLHQIFEGARNGNGRVLLLQGAPGVGKSRLVHDFLEELVAPDGPVLLASRCAASGGGSWQPFRDAFGDLLGGEERTRERLAELLPDLPEATVSRFAQFLLGADPDAAAEGIVPAFERLLKNLAAGRPVVLVVEDLHHAGPETVELFGHLGRAIVYDPVLLIGTLRREAVAEGSPVHTMIAAATQRPETVAPAVDPLSRDATDEFIRAFVKHGRTVRALGRPLYARSDGNPHILLEMLAHLKGTGALVEKDDGLVLAAPLAEVGLPNSIRDLFARRLAALDDEERETLEAAAACGPEFEATLLAAVLETKKIRLLKRLAVLERKHRLITSSGRNAFRFASRALHEVVYEGLAPETRARYHGMCAEAIAEERGEEGGLTGAQAHARVRHLLAAGRLADAGPDLEAAMEHAARQQHPLAAAEFLEALASALDGAQRFEALLKLAHVYEMLGRQEARMNALGRARAEAERLGGPGPQGRVHAGLAAAFWRAGSYEEAEREAREGLRLAREAGDREGEALCVHTLATVSFQRGEFEVCAAHCREALELQRAAGDRRGEATTLQALGAVMPEVGEKERALEVKQEALKLFREIGDRRGEGGALNNVGNSYVETQQLEEALVCYEQAVKIARETGDLPAEAAALYNRGRALAVLARIEEAIESFEQALDLYREIGDPSGEAEVLDDLGFSIAQYGEQDNAIRHLEQARETAARTGRRALVARVLRHLANLLHTKGEQKRAWRHYEEALALATQRGRVLARADMGNAALNEGDHDRAIRLLEEALKERASGSRGLVSLCRLARAYKAAGREEEATRCARRAENLLDEQRNVPPQYGPEIYYSLGTVFPEGEGARKYLSLANELLSSRTRSIRSVVRRQNYLTMTWPNREILEYARKLT